LDPAHYTNKHDTEMQVPFLQYCKTQLDDGKARAWVGIHNYTMLRKKYKAQNAENGFGFRVKILHYLITCYKVNIQIRLYTTEHDKKNGVFIKQMFARAIKKY